MVPIRVKLLVLLLVISLVPLVLVIWFDQRATRQLGLDLADRAREMLERRAAEQLLQSIGEAAERVRGNRILLETALALQARAVEAALAAPVALPAGMTAETEIRVEGPAEAARRLRALGPFLAALHAHQARNAAWHHVVLDSGVRAIFPAHSGALPEPPAPWVQRTRQAGRLVWNPPGLDPVSGRPVLTVSAPVRGPDGTAIGATAMDLPVSGVLAVVEQQPFPGARALLVEPAEENGLRLVARRDGDGPLTLEAGPTIAAVLDDMRRGVPGVRRLQSPEGDFLWAYGAVDDYGTHLLFVVPYAEVVAEAIAAQDEVLQRVSHQRIVLWLSLVVFVPVVVVLALVASRAVTRPVSELAEAARRLAGGDFAARARIRSGDELEMLSRLFNAMVPRLEENIRMRESLALAQEVQQNLLPQMAPVVEGFDLAGLSLYCDETGGDYYDFFDPAQLGPGRVALAVGDVTGHGIAAALMMTTARALLRAQMPEPGRLAAMMSAVNRRLAADTHAGRYMTLFFALLDGPARTVHWVSAGHAPALIYDPAEDVFREVAGEDIPLGIDPDWIYHELGHSGWRAGTVMVVGTDGIWETRNPEGEMFGHEALKQVIRRHARESAESIAQAVAGALAAFRGARPQEDDITLVVGKATG